MEHSRYITPHQSSAQDAVDRACEAKAQVRRVLKLRTSRNRIFSKALFGEPAWDMLLQLYDAQLEGRTEYVTGLCEASGVPQTTALRWISCLEDRNLIRKEHDIHDQRRILVSLTAAAADAMERFFSQPEFGTP